MTETPQSRADWEAERDEQAEPGKHADTTTTTTTTETTTESAAEIPDNDEVEPGNEPEPESAEPDGNQDDPDAEPVDDPEPGDDEPDERDS